MNRNDTLKPLDFVYKTEVKVAFSETDIFALFLFAEQHYDGECRMTAAQGGILWGLRNRLDCGFAVTYLTPNEVDLIAKVCECDPVMSGKLSKVVQACNKEYERLNKR